MRRALYEVELDTEELISSIIHSRAEWEEARWTPFRENVHREAVGV